jgi:hypothetical protein
MDFDYKNYALQRLEEWLHDCMSSGEATPQEIYDTIKNVVQEQYDYYKNGTEKTNELLSLLDGVKKLEFNLSDLPEYYGMSGTGSSDDYIHFNTDPAGNVIDFCDNNNPSPYCKGSWNSFWDENNHSENSEEHSKYYYEYDRNDSYRANPFVDKVVKWQLPVQMDDAAGDADPIYYVNFPDDLLEAANLKEGDNVEWVDNLDGSYLLRKI